MEKAQLAAMCFLLSTTFAAIQALRCMSASHCCKARTLNEVVKGLTVHSSHSSHASRSSRSVPSSDDCRSIPGANNMASSSPWRYVKDTQDFRYPWLLLRAQCACEDSCVSLRHPVRNGTRNVFEQKERNGKSVPIFADTDVYYRRPCGNDNTSFYLEPSKYSLPVACTCVAA